MVSPRPRSRTCFGGRWARERWRERYRAPAAAASSSSSSIRADAWTSSAPWTAPVVRSAPATSPIAAPRDGGSLDSAAEALMEAVVLAGGLGTRLRARVPDVPKAMAPVAGRPFLAWLLDELADAGFRRVVLSVGHLADVIRNAFGGTYRS